MSNFSENEKGVYLPQNNTNTRNHLYKTNSTSGPYMVTCLSLRKMSPPSIPKYSQMEKNAKFRLGSNKLGKVKRRIVYGSENSDHNSDRAVGETQDYHVDKAQDKFHSRSLPINDNQMQVGKERAQTAIQQYRSRDNLNQRTILNP